MKAMRYFVIPVSAVLLPAAVYATNGMNLEGYGPEALGMGGASMAYDNGAAATMNNPATIGLMPDGHRADFALGLLGPDVSAKVGSSNANSSGTAYYMPALGWLSKSGGFSYGVGMFAQGGMGTEYGKTSWMADPSQGANTALTEGLVNRSELGVGRFIIPISYEVAPNFVIGGSIDYVWAGLDIMMAMSKGQFENLANPAAQTIGTAKGSFVDTFGMMYQPFGGTGVADLYHAQFDFSDGSDFTGEAKGTGFGGKIGAVFQASPDLSIGATYHSKTALKDLKTSDATVRVAGSFDNNILNGTFGTLGPSGTYSDAIIPVTGTMKVKDFQWPAMFGIGMAFKPVEGAMLVADVKRIFWGDAMKNFNMVFTSDNVASNGGFANLKLDANLFQHWEDQTVIALGGSYAINSAWTVRAGYNRASNPIPNKYLNALFPAIEETHITAGFGYAVSKAASIDFALSKGLEVSATNPGNGSTIPAVKSTMSQLNWQVAFGYRY